MYSPELSFELPMELVSRLQSPRPPFYLHQPPTWLWRSVLALASGLSIAALGFGLHAVSVGRAGPAELAVGAFGLVFLLICARPRRWQPPVSCVADASGLHFLGSDTAMPARFLPWADVGEPYLGFTPHGAGLMRSVVLPVKADSAFLRSGLASPLATALAPSAEEAGYRPVAIGNNGRRPARTLSALKYLRALRATAER